MNKKWGAFTAKKFAYLSRKDSVSHVKAGTFLTDSLK